MGGEESQFLYELAKDAGITGVVVWLVIRAEIASLKSSIHAAHSRIDALVHHGLLVKHQNEVSREVIVTRGSENG